MRLFRYLVQCSLAVGIVTSVQAQTVTEEQDCLGRRAWQRYGCHGCHGDRATGGMGPNILNDIPQISVAMMQGEMGHGMRSYDPNNTASKNYPYWPLSDGLPDVTTQQIQADAASIAVYLQSIKQSNAKTPLVNMPPIIIPDTSSEATFVDWEKKNPSLNKLSPFAGLPAPNGVMPGKTCNFNTGE